MHFESTPDPQDLTIEQRAWIDRYLAIIPALESMEAGTRASFDELIDHVLEGRYGSFPVVADSLNGNGPSIEILPFLVPIIEELLDHLADGTLVETDEAWVLITDDEESDSDTVVIDAETLELTDSAMAERFEVVMMELRGLEADHRTHVVDQVFDIIETYFMDHPGIAAYYDTGRPNNESAFVIVPLFEAALAGNCTFKR
jgi:hypothetical protein